jgi:hypothetical protein
MVPCSNDNAVKGHNLVYPKSVLDVIPNFGNKLGFVWTIHFVIYTVYFAPSGIKPQFDILISSYL